MQAPREESNLSVSVVCDRHSYSKRGIPPRYKMCFAENKSHAVYQWPHRLPATRTKDSGSCTSHLCCTAAGLPGRNDHNAARECRQQRTAGICTFAMLVLPVGSSNVPNFCSQHVAYPVSRSKPSRSLAAYGLSHFPAMRLPVHIEQLLPHRVGRRGTRRPHGLSVQYSRAAHSPLRMAGATHPRAHFYP